MSQDLSLLREVLAHADLAVFEEMDELGYNALLQAVTYATLDSVKILIEAGCDINANDEPNIGYTPLDVAIKNQNVECVRYLLEQGADPHIPTWMQNTAPDRAASEAVSVNSPAAMEIWEMLKPHWSLYTPRKGIVQTADKHEAYARALAREPFPVGDAIGSRGYRISWDTPHAASELFLYELARTIHGARVYLDLQLSADATDAKRESFLRKLRDSGYGFNDAATQVIACTKPISGYVPQVFALAHNLRGCDARIFTTAPCALEFRHDDHRSACYCYGDVWMADELNDTVTKVSRNLQLNIRIEEWPQ